MSYLVIARKYRPQKFSEVVGQEQVTKALVNTIIKDKVPHALLLTGPRGVGKTTSARIFARALNCTEVKKGEPCGKCSNCKEINSGSSLAVWEIDGASNNSVDNVRELIDSLRTLPPPGSKHKIYIIDEVHMLSTAAFNALLKSLEEPPANTVFIFATTDPQKIPDTVISRCQRYDFTRLKDEKIIENLSDVLKQEKVKCEKEVLEFIARKADGGLRDAQSMLDRAMVFAEGGIKLDSVLNLFGAVDKKFFSDLALAIKNQDTKTCLDLVDKTFQRSLDIKYFVTEFISFWRDALVSKFANKNFSNKGSNRIPAEISEISAFDLQRIFEIAEQTSTKALKSSYPQFIIEAGVIRMATIMDLQPIVSLLSGTSITASTNSDTLKKRVEKITEVNNTMQKEVNSIASTNNIKNISSEKKTIETEHVEAGPVEAGQIKKEQVEKAVSFNPSWEEFLKDLSKQGLVRLKTYLKRVAPSEFKLGTVKLMATNFDIEALQDQELLEQMRNCLYRYSGSQDWRISFEEIKDSISIPGSEDTKEKEQKVAKREVIKNKAIKDQALKDVLSVFEGSKVQKVSILD